MTLSVEHGSWILRQFDTDDDVTGYRFRFLRWVELDARDDLAAIEFVDPWSGWNGRGQHRAVLASRHVGFDLRALDASELPAHVHLMTSEPELEDATHFEPGELARTAWATIAPVDAVLPEQPQVAVRTIRQI
jgi:hypothetical protein